MKVKIALILFKLLSKISIKSAHRLATVLSTIFFWLPTREGKITKTNVHKVFHHKSIKYQRWLVKKSLIEGMKSLLESMPIWKLNKQELLNKLKVYGVEHIENIENNGIIFITPHIASWEITNLWLSVNYELSSLYRIPKIEKMDPVIKKSREKFGTKMSKNNIKGVLQLKKVLDKKKMILVSPDQDPGENGSIMVDFFKIPARTGTLVPKLCKKTKSKVLLIYTIRKNNHFDLRIEKASEKIYDQDIKIATQAMNDDLEKIILKNPEQYSWSYKRYKFQSNGSKFYD